jgi:hypothetical protein
LPHARWPAPIGAGQARLAASGWGTSWRSAELLGALLGGHAALGWAVSQSKTAATIHAIAVAAAALGLTLSVPRPTAVLGVCAYIAGCEVLWRMCGAAIFWEAAKYLMAAVLIIALARRGNARAPAAAVFYFALLLPSALLTLALLEWTAARQQLSFNLSGPFALALAVAYFSNARLRMEDLRLAAAAVAAPVTAIAAVVALRMAALGEIEFAMDSNFGSSGGFGPNQVSAMLGLGGLFCLLAALFCRPGLVERVLALGFCAVLLLQSALTFSRGGVYIAMASAGAAAVFLFRAGEARSRLLLAAGALSIAAVAGLPDADAWTGGRLIERFTTPDLTHRDELLWDDLAIWAANPVFGVGPGRAAEERGVEFGGAAAHTEFTRALAEHGLFGLASIAILGWMTLRRFSAAVAPEEKALLAALFVWPLLFMAVNSMRIAAPSLLFGLAFVRWVPATRTANWPVARAMIRRRLFFTAHRLLSPKIQ